MKKLLFISIVIVLAGILIFGSCAEEPTTTVPATTTPTKTTPPTAITTATSPVTGEPVRGGVLRRVTSALPKVLGYTPEFSVTEEILMLPVLERLCEWDGTGKLIPVLAESWESDSESKTITWHLRKGVKFHDGTDWNAEALRWNFQLLLDTQRLTDAKYVKSLEVVDEYTLRMHLTIFRWLMIEDYGWFQMISPTAFEKAGATEEERIEWARANAVGTGAFKISEFQRDVVIKYVKNDNYWRKGMPYLDGIEVWNIPDPLVAATKLEAGEADMVGLSSPENILDLQDKGFKMNQGPGMVQELLFNSNDPDSIFANKKVREAIEYAIDRPTIAQMLGHGLYIPCTQIASPTRPSYVEGYDPRPYNPEKARQLLAEAGYPSGFKTTILCTEMARDAMAAIQSYLGEVGITVDVDVADMGRYFGAIFGTGWEEMAFAAHGIHPDGKEVYIHFGPEPATYRTGNIYKSPEFLAKCNEGLDPKYKDAFEAMPKIREIIKQAGEDAMVVPLWITAEVQMYPSYVYSDYLTVHSIIWTSYDDWMEKH